MVPMLTFVVLMRRCVDALGLEFVVSMRWA